MNWNEVVLRDRSLSQTARDLVHLVSKYFAVHAIAQASFADLEAARLIGLTVLQIEEARKELERKSYLHRLPAPNGKKARFEMRLGFPKNGDEAA
jgi:hypothetical protein